MADNFQQLGVTGLKHFSGDIHEEFLRQLSGNKAVKTYKEMSSNDPVIGGILFATEMLLRNVEWTTEPASEDPVDVEIAEFFDSCRNDMSHSWSDFIAEVLSMLPYGWSTHEIIYKKRLGPEQEDGMNRSKYSDGMIGWRKLPIRSQDTLDKWVFDEEGGISAFVQRKPNTGQTIEIPIEKAILFRPSAHKNNPEGKALDPETLIPTPDGWKILDDIKPGDKVFDENGSIRYVVGREDWEDRPCYAIRFGDNTEIIADENHEWLTTRVHDKSNNKPAQIRTTTQILSTLKNSNGVTNHSIVWAKALDYPEQYLLIPPWFFGLWLGDGTSANANISCHLDDVEETRSMIEECGYTAKISKNGQSECGRLISVSGKNGSHDSTGPTHCLRILGVKHNKHIPDCYLRGSIRQRMLLLAGLMDSDGTVNKDGACEFTNVNRNLADGVCELVRSLGIIPKFSSKINSAGNVSFVVKFTPDFAPFRLSRKVNRCKLARARKKHYIKDIIRVQNRRTVCIEVDSPSHLFLAGESMVPTHNSVLRTAYRPWYFKKRIEEIEGIGIERDLAGLPVAHVPPELLDGNADAETKQSLNAIKTLIRNIRRDEQEGVVFPLAYDDNGKELFKLELLSTGGARQFNTSEIVSRYDKRIAMTILADFIMLGQDKVGSFALSSDKTKLFATALGAWLKAISEPLNRHAIPRLGRLNNIPPERLPYYKPGDIEQEDLEAWANAVNRLVLSGSLIPDENIDSKARDLLDISARESDGTEG